MTTQCIFPPELVFTILYYSEPRDIIRWRTVSKWFCAITCEDVLWIALYADASFPRPPGPSPLQPTPLLERMLVKSAALAHSWLTRTMREVSSTSIKLEKPLGEVPFKLICGRWLVGCEEARRFVLFDADARCETHARKVLWEQQEPVVSAWDVHPVSPVEGRPYLYVLFQMSEVGENSPNWKLLLFGLKVESGEVYDTATLDPPAWARGPLERSELRGGKSRFLFIPTKTPQGVMIDTQTHIFYELPPMRVALKETIPHNFSNRPVIDFRMAFTGTHIFCFYYYRDRFRGVMTLVQLFAMPSESEASAQGDHPVLLLTHEGFDDWRLFDIGIMMRGFDPVMRETYLKFVDHSDPFKNFNLYTYDVTIPESIPGKVLPIKLKWGMITIPNEGVRMIHYTDSCLYLDLCDNQILRGIFRAKPKEKFWELEENQHIMKFSVDTRQDSWFVECGKIAQAEWREAQDARSDETGESIQFDALRGRLSYLHPKNKDQVIVVDME